MLAIVKFQAEGFHRWPGATGQRAYLEERHRHMFHWTVMLEVFHHDREVEYHDLLDFCQINAPCGEMGAMSCEEMASKLAFRLMESYPGRQYRIMVLEDGECGALLESKTGESNDSPVP